MPSLQFIGSGDAFGSGGRLQTCFLLRCDESIALIDCGATSPAGLDRAGIAPPDIDAVIVSHLHGDHFGGIPFLLLDAAYNRPRRTPLTIAGPSGLEDRVLAVFDLLYPGLRSKLAGGVPFAWVELPAGTPTAVGRLTVRAHPVEHSSAASAHALRVETPRVAIGYSGDTEWTPALVHVARDADLFVCECVGWDTAPPSHLSHAVLEAHAHELTPKRMMLTHLGPAMLAHVHEARWPCAEDGMRIEI